MYRNVIKRFDNLVPMKPLPIPESEKVYLRKEFSPDSVCRLYANFKNGMIRTFLDEKEERIRQVQIIQHPALRGGEG